MQIDKDERSGVLKLSGDVGIDGVEQLQSALLDIIRTVPKPTVDLSEVESCDTAALQLLCSARKTAEQAEKPFELFGPSPAILDASAALGLSLMAGKGAEDAV